MTLVQARKDFAEGLGLHQEVIRCERGGAAPWSPDFWQNPLADGQILAVQWHPLV